MYNQNHPHNSLTAGYQIRVRLIGVEPIIWRRFLFCADNTFADLHRAIQLAFDWNGDLLYRFNLNAATVGSPHTLGGWTSESAEIALLGDFSLREKQRFLYEYSLRDKWEIAVRVEKVCSFDAAKIYPICSGGRRAAPPERSGGAEQFAWQRDHYSATHVNRRMLELCSLLLAYEPAPAEWQSDIADIQIELEELRYWLSLDQFDRRAVNIKLKQQAQRAVSRALEQGCAV